MKIKTYIFTIAIASLLVSPISAKKKPFYDSKSNIVCITGDYELLEYGNKFRKVEVTLPKSFGDYTPEQIESALKIGNYGKKILDYLFCYNGMSLSEDRLKDLAMQNVLKSDDERASIGVISKGDILKEDYLPILENNYIFVLNTKKGRRHWSVYKVEINKNILEQVFNSWNEMDKYNQIKVPITFVCSDRAKITFNTDTNENGLKKKTKRKIAKKVPAFAIRGKVTGRSPLTTDLGAAYGLKNCAQVAVYRTKEKNGTKYSSKVCTTRACNVADSTANLYTFAGGQASYKKGDVAVYQPSSNMSFSVTGEYMDHSYGIGLTADKRLGLSRIGISQYVILKLGAGIYEHHGKRLYATNTGDVVDSPIYMNFGLGYGLGYEFAHCLEIEPYLMAQWESLYFAIKHEASKAVYINGTKIDMGGQQSSDSSKKSVVTSAVRIPIGVKLNLNILYPLQLIAGGEYIFNFNLDENSYEYNMVSNAERFFFTPTGYKRSGLNFYAGLRFNF